MKSRGAEFPESDRRIWDPKHLFRAGSEAEFCDPATGARSVIKWSLTRVRSTGIPIIDCRCSISDASTMANGSAEGWDMRSTLVKAFAESWERLWMKKLSAARRDGFPQVTSSNGFAASSTTEGALENSRHELMERALLLTAWSSRRGWVPYELKSALSRLLNSVMSVRAGWRSQFFSISADGLGTTLAGLLLHPELGAVFDSVFVGRSSGVKGSELKLVTSLVKIAQLQVLIKPLASLPSDGSPEDHLAFYRDAKNSEAFEFLQWPEAQRDSLLISTPDTITSREVVPAGRFPAVAFSWNPRWPTLSWGRSSIGGDNPWPHPLA